MLLGSFYFLLSIFTKWYSIIDFDAFSLDIPVSGQKIHPLIDNGFDKLPCSSL